MGWKNTWIDFLVIYCMSVWLLVILFHHLWLLYLCSDDAQTEWLHWAAASSFSLQSPVAGLPSLSDTIIRHLCLCRLLPDEDAIDPKTARQQWIREIHRASREQCADSSAHVEEFSLDLHPFFFFSPYFSMTHLVSLEHLGSQLEI